MSAAPAPAAPSTPSAPAPAPEREAAPGVWSKLRFIAALWRPQRGFLVLLALLTLVSAVVAVAWPLVVKVVLDGIDIDASAGQRPLGELLGVLALIAFGRVVAMQYPATRALVNLRIARHVRARVMAKVLEADGRLRAEVPTGDMVTRLTSDLDDYPAIAWFSCSGIFRAVESAAKAAFSVAAMVWLSPLVTLVSLAPLPIMLWVFYRVRGRLTEAYLGQQKARSHTSELLEAAFSGIQIVKAFNTGPQQADRLAAVLDRRIALQFDVQRLHAAIHAVDAVATRFGQALAIVAGGWLVLDGSLGVGALYAIVIYLDMLIGPLQDLPNLLVTGRQAFSSIERVAALEQAAEQAAAIPPALAPEHEENVRAPLEELSLVGVTVKYEGLAKRDAPPAAPDESARRPALLDASLTLRRGERVAVVGPVGSGKTTLARAVVGLVQLADGELRWNGAPLGAPPPLTVRARVGYVPQDPTLLAGTIRWNVGFDRAPERDEVDRALTVAQLDRDLALLPLGADTALGARGNGLSGGQRQRVALARALARRPELLVLDDSTAALDAESEHRFWDALDARYPSVTTLVTTHRLATVERADRVVILDGGRIVASGTHTELARESAGYRRLLALAPAAST